MINTEYYPQEVAETIAQLAELSHLTDQKDLTDFFYDLIAIAENKYNRDYFRTAWNALQTICERFERGDIQCSD